MTLTACQERFLPMGGAWYNIRPDLTGEAAPAGKSPRKDCPLRVVFVHSYERFRGAVL
jgi:hypothetical protein